MAQSANSAFMLWRQFSGEAKAPVHQNLKTPGVATQHGEQRMGPSMGDQLRAFASAAGDLFNAQQSLEKAQKAEADQRVTSWMNQHTMAEYRQKMREGNVPFQNDPVAMDILHNNAAYGVALEVEEAIQNKVKAGEYKTVEDAEKARIEALNGARSEYALSMGISPDSKAFITGFDRQADQRRNMLVSLQQDVTDKNLRTQAKIAATSSILAPLTDDFVRAANPQTTASYIVNSVKQQQTLGQIRSDADAAEVMGKAIESLKGTAGGAAALKALGDMEYDLYGVKGKLRDHLGGGVFDQAVIGALDREQQQDAIRQNGLNASLIKLQRTNDLGGLLKLQEDLTVASGGKETRELQSVRQTIKATEEKLARENAAAMEQYAKNAEKQSRLFNAVDTYRQAVAGDLSMVSLNYTDLGLKDRAEASEAQQAYLSGIEDPQEKFKSAIKLAGMDKDGFAANALKTQNDEAGVAWDQYVLKLQRGDTTAALPEKVKYMQDLYMGNPEAFTMVYKDPDYIQALELGRVTGSSPQDVALAQVAWKKLPEEQKKAATTELARQVNKVGTLNPAYVNDAIKTMAAPYLTMGMDAEKAVKTARDQYEKQTVKFWGSPIHKGFFQLNAEPASFEFGKSTFEQMLPEARKAVGDPGGSYAVLQYDHNNQVVIVRNIQTGESTRITREDLQAKAAVLQEEAKAKETLKVEQEIKDTTTSRERNKRQQESMNRLSGVNFYK